MAEGKVIARGTIRVPAAEQREMVPLIAEHVRLSNAERGCIVFDITPSAHDPELYVVTEEFTDCDAFAAHTARTRASEWWAKSKHLVRDIRIYDRPDKSPLPDWSAPAAPPADLFLEGNAVRLKPLTTSHAQALFEELSDDGWQFLPNGPYESAKDFSDWVASVEAQLDPHMLAIIRRSDNRPVGFCSYLRITPSAGSIEVGFIHFSPALRQSAVATEAMFLMMGWAFDAGYRRYEWKCDATNLPSRRAAERLGFSFEGVFRQATIVKGLNRDTAWFAMTDKEWPALRACFEAWLSPANFDAAGHQKTRLSHLTAPHRVASDPALG